MSESTLTSADLADGGSTFDVPPSSPTVPAYASTTAPYGSLAPDGGEGALVIAVVPESPADDLGIECGMRVLSVNGKPLTDMIVWLWESDGDDVEIEVFDPRDDTVTPAILERFPGEEWGMEFDGAVFDGMRTCVNACVFCFMNMLPKESRNTLTIRDDDYRLSFLQGNFVTLTNMTDAEADDAIDKMLSPMNVSLHAITPECRRKLIGRNAPRGIEVLERFLDAGIEIHAQIVLCPGLNDGDELLSTLRYVEAHPGITSLAIVPLGFTKHQKRFATSYSDDVEASRAVVRMLEPFQQRARTSRGATVFQLADEFYIDAELPVPPAETYDGFPQFYDGIGMLRSFLDEADALRRDRAEDLSAAGELLAADGRRALVICGEAAQSTFDAFCAAFAPAGAVSSRAIKNEYFGGNVNVTGLICACDLMAQLPQDLANVTVLIPDVMFNYDSLTLDGVERCSITAELERRGATVRYATPAPSQLLDALLTG